MDLILDELNSFKAELVQLDIYGHAKEFIYNRPGKKHGVISSLAVFIKDYFTWLRKRLYSSSLIFSNLIKVTKILMKNVQHSCLCFISLRALGALRFIVSIKNVELYKILPWDKFFTKKKRISKHISKLPNFFRIAMFSCWFSWCFRIANVYQYLHAIYI